LATHAFNYGDLKIFSGRAHPALAQEICAYLGIPLGELTLYNFSDGEDYCQIDENVRGADVFVVQPTCSPVNDHVMELLILLDAFRRSSASRLTAVMPYFGYARQDKKDKPRVPIAAKLMADLLTASGADRILTMDLHTAQIQGFFNIPVDHLFAAPVLLDAVRKLELDDLVIVSPDVGGLTRARAIAKRLDASLAVIDKRRTGKNETEILNVVGEVEGKDALHGVFSGPALERIGASKLERLLVTNTIPVEAAQARCPRIKALSVAPLLGEAIQRIHDGASVSSLFV
jgi:ribose-phosphate pyrophosphokinase